MLKILQWNLGGTPHARHPKPHPNPTGCGNALSEILREFQPAIVALQEATDDVLFFAKTKDYDLQRGALGLITLVHRSHYSIAESRNINARVQQIKLDSLMIGGQGIILYNVHLPVLYKTETERRNANRKLLKGPDIVSYLVQNPAYVEVVVGDFNLPPYDEFIVGDSDLFANRDLSYIQGSRSTAERALYNASWAIFGGECGSLGTYYGESVPHGPWQIPDQMLLHPKLLEDKAIKVQVINQLVSSPQLTLGTSGGRPSKKHASDHFPVLVTISSATKP